MPRWVLLHNRYHIAVINRQSPTWVWVHHQLPLLELLVPTLVNSEDIIERMFLAEVDVEVDRLVVDISVVILLPCLKPRKLQKLLSRNAPLLDSNFQFLVLRLRKPRTVRLQTTRMGKAKLRVPEITFQPVLAYVAEAVDMVGVKAWLSVPTEEVAQLCVVAAPSNSLCNQAQMLQLAGRVLICRGEEAPLDTIEILRATSKAIGETNQVQANPNKISRVQWATFRASKLDSNLVIAIVVR
jgi:hypothetical protein